MPAIPIFEQNQTILFQGDSITDCGRDRSDPASRGVGYASIASAWMEAAYPHLHLTFHNRGISGNRVKDLLQRWDTDCLALKPDWISILIGINDTWRRYDSGDATSMEDFEHGYRLLLKQTCDHSQARLILCEPFVLPYPEDRTSWRADLDPKIHVVRNLAREYGAIYVPFDGLLAVACARREPAFWAADGVHPTPAGHALMAMAWLNAVQAL